MLVMVIQVNPTIDKVLYYLVLKDQALNRLRSRFRLSKPPLRPVFESRFLFFKSKKMNWLAMTRTSMVYVS